MEEDGIQLNFAAPSTSSSVGRVQKKQGGRWTDRLKANKAIKRKSGPNEKGTESSPAKSRPNPSTRPAIAASYTKPTQTVVATPAPARSQTTQDRATKRPRVEAPSKASNDDFGNVDIAALARRSTNHNAKTQTQSTAYASSSRPQQAQTQSQGIVSSLFTGLGDREAQVHQDGEARETMDVMDRRSRLDASNAPYAARADETQASVRANDDRTFEGLGLDPLLAAHLKTKMGIERPTRIQRVALKGLLDPTPLTTSTTPAQFSLLTSQRSSTVRDAFIQSQTGSGKTLSYLLPIIQTLLPLASSKDVGYVDRSIGTLGIVLAPTRELARQIWGVTERILGMKLSAASGGGVLDDMAKTVEAKDGGITQEDGSLDPEDDEEETQRRRPIYQRYLVTTLLTGGSTRTHEKSRLRKGCPILISTPGRLLDHLQNTQSFKVDRLLWLVLDEADRLIEEGFGETLEGIMKAIEGRRRIGIELDGQGLGRSKAKKFVPPKMISGKQRAPFEEDEDEDEGDDDDDEWDYELAGPKQNGHKLISKREAVESGQTAVSTQMNWPYWSLGRRTILCSATVSGEVQKLAGVALKDPVMYRASDAGKIDEAEEDDEPELKDLANIGQGQGQQKGQDKVEEEPEQDVIELSSRGKEEKFTPPSQLDQRYMIVPTKLRLVTLVSLLRTLIAKVNNASNLPAGQGMKVIVFMSCTDSVDFHWKMMGGVQMGAPPAKEEDDEDEEDLQDDAEKKKKKLKAKKVDDPISFTCPLLPSTSIMRLHGSLPLQIRRESLAAFSQASTAESESKHSILFCTSVASRGLDLPLVRAVIQYDLPTEQGVAEYVHRVGRTARVGKGGESWAFVESAEQEWVPWVQEGMTSTDKEGKVAMRQVIVEDVLKRGFSPKGGAPNSREFEQRATQVQLAFERWVLENNQNANLARQAFSSYVRAYSTHPHEEKRFFHVKNLHLGHLAKCFGLRETPGKIGGGGGGGKKDKSGKRKRGDASDEEDEDEGVPHVASGGKSAGAKTDIERRMYEAVRRQGKLTKVGGVLAAGGGDQEFQVALGGKDLERMVSGNGSGGFGRPKGRKR